MKIYKCEKCGEGFSNFQQKANHTRWHHKELVYSASGLIKLHESVDKQYGKLVVEIVKCTKCEKEITIKYRCKKPKKSFCSRSCANSRIFSEESKAKKSKETKRAWKEGIYDHLALTQNKGKLRFTSKGEEELREYMISHFPDDNWTFGGNLKVEEKRISRDLYSNKLKVCVEYDGVWHFKDIKGQLKKKQRTDELLEQWCLLNNFRLIRIKEEVYLENKKKTLNRLIQEIQTGMDKIVKFY